LLIEQMNSAYTATVDFDDSRNDWLDRQQGDETVRVPFGASSSLNRIGLLPDIQID
jgi:hypothetical protein